jgi:hypothetical protein
LEISDENKNNEANESVHKEEPEALNRLLYKENVRLLIGQLPALFEKKIRTERDFARRALPS